MKIAKKLLALILLAGTIFSWYTVYNDFARFYGVYQTVFRVNNCIIPNPVVTPCFYGAFAFLGAFIWSILILKKSEEKHPTQYRNLIYLLIGSNIFAWSNFLLQLLKFLRAGSKPVIGCSGQLMTNPFTTPCFIGSAFFVGALIVCSLIVIKNKKPRILA